MCLGKTFTAHASHVWTHCFDGGFQLIYGHLDSSECLFESFGEHEAFGLEGRWLNNRLDLYDSSVTQEVPDSSESHPGSTATRLRCGEKIGVTLLHVFMCTHLTLDWQSQIRGSPKRCRFS